MLPKSLSLQLYGSQSVVWQNLLFYHNSDVAWVLWCLRSQAMPLFFPQLVQANNKPIKASHYWCFTSNQLITVTNGHYCGQSFRIMTSSYILTWCGHKQVFGRAIIGLGQCSTFDCPDDPCSSIIAIDRLHWVDIIQNNNHTITWRMES